MPVEGISCPNDGATTGISRVGPDTFSCSHCKGLFKYVHPERPGATYDTAFCEDGNRVEFRCQLCQKDLCRECDVIEWQGGFTQGARHAAYLRYLEEVRDRPLWKRRMEEDGTAKDLVYDDDQPRKREHRAGTPGPYALGMPSVDAEVASYIPGVSLSDMPGIPLEALGVPPHVAARYPHGYYPQPQPAYPAQPSTMGLRKLAVPVRDFGYLGSPYAGLVIDGRITSQSTDSPVLYADEILAVLKPEHPGELRHLCCECLLTGIPAAVQAIGSGRMCEFPGCSAAPSAQCRCCESAFCALHGIKPSPAHTRRRNAQASVTWLARVCQPATFNSDAFERSFHGPETAGLCPVCETERAEEARGEITAVIGADPAVTGGEPGLRRIPTFTITNPVWQRLLQYCFPTIDIRGKRAQVIWRRLEKAVDAKNQELSQLSMPCMKDRIGGGPESYRIVRRSKRS